MSKYQFPPASGFKVPKNRKGIKVSTPTCHDETDSALVCNLSAIRPGTTKARRVRHASVPRASTPTNDEAALSFDVSSIKARSISTNNLCTKQPQSRKGTVTKNGHDSSSQLLSNKVSKQVELDAAYNTYLLSLAIVDQAKQHAVVKDEIEVALGTLSRRLAANQLNLENTRQRVNAISFTSELSQLQGVKRKTAVEALAQAEGTARAVSALASAVGNRVDNLELRNIASGTAELKKVIADCNNILNKLRATNGAGEGRITEADNYLGTIGDLAEEINARSGRISNSLPRYQSVAISLSTIETQEKIERERTEGQTLETAEESSVADALKTRCPC